MIQFSTKSSLLVILIAVVSLVSAHDALNTFSSAGQSHFGQIHNSSTTVPTATEIVSAGPSDSVAALLTSYLSLLVAIAFRMLTSLSRFTRRYFIDPALMPTEDTAEQLGIPFYPRHVVRPFVTLSIQRLQLSSYLLFLGLSLASSVISLMTSRYLTAGLSLMLYASGLLSFSFLVYFGLAFFHWSTMNKMALTIFISSLVVLAIISPTSVDFFRLLSSEPFSLAALLVIVSIYLATRSFVGRKYPSLRHVILEELGAEPQGRTLDEWLSLLSSLGLRPSRERVEEQLVELVQHGELRLKIAGTPMTIVYAKRV